MTSTDPGGSRPPAGRGKNESGDRPSTSPLRSLKDRALALWYQKPGPRAPRTIAPPAPGEKEIVNGLDRREVLIGAFLTVVDVALALLAYFHLHASHLLKDRQAAATYLVAGLIAAGIMTAGVAFRRRALLGFGAFFVGMQLLTTGLLPEAVVFLFFGGWLIFRVMKKQRQDQAAGRFKGTIDTGGRRRGREETKTPTAKASKRYTPPRRRAPARRR